MLQGEKLAAFWVIISPECHVLSSNLQPSRGSAVSLHYLVWSTRIAHYVVLPTKNTRGKKINRKHPLRLLILSWWDKKTTKGAIANGPGFILNTQNVPESGSVILGACNSPRGSAHA